ncbi:nucleolar protein 3-like [Argiope bruennichi]|uniref:Uncharacterized protein n=1 Tax=Argiope bruennichi TaxID=94029 RepID=A0A8T0FKX5_ARGBR|nr:nucleolar protein 3-like [Argiope bruennichi]KAF8791857.1 hypothetical protein HNY73_003527 [Argiope bruennichi]
MATDAKRNKFLYLERERLTRYQHQHRGLSFLKLWLPPITDRDVNIIGLNNHIYKGKIPTAPLDKLPPEVDPKSIDEEQLYKEIRDMRFPVAPPLEPLGPTRRVGGVYTTAKRMAFAPVQISLADDKTQMPLLGKDGKIYQGRTKRAPTHELDQRLKGTKRPVKTPAQYESDRGTVKPTVVSLYVDGKPPSERKPHVPIIQMPCADLNKLIKSMGIKSPEQEKDATKTEQTEKQSAEEAEQEAGSKSTEAEESEGESSGEFASFESIGETGEASEIEETSTTTGTEASSEMTIEETSTTTGTEASSEITEPVSEGEEIEEADIPEPEPEEEESDIPEPEPEEEEADIPEPEPEEEEADIPEPEPEEEADIPEPEPEEEEADIPEPEPEEEEPEDLELEPEEM